ncbi:MAG: hypothetical protein AVDCRST_MAG41-1420 [uncultured Corynebacteriales bacterium]|uniref:Uncharacterized protein n=1 Tax=uncultured Mycobacteriales bacterium TaxID=581187 RepID=A0A6J4I4Y3_9ACTN|nr:MAG: hypothetical protein AVDCRST_MAG41-1420 [uncultured Corynebacteriales bacterium]
MRASASSANDWPNAFDRSASAGVSENRPLGVSSEFSRASTSTPPTSVGSPPVTWAAYATLASRPASEKDTSSPT